MCGLLCVSRSSCDIHVHVCARAFSPANKTGDVRSASGRGSSSWLGCEEQGRPGQPRARTACNRSTASKSGHQYPRQATSHVTEMVLLVHAAWEVALEPLLSRCQTGCSSSAPHLRLGIMAGLLTWRLTVTDLSARGEQTPWYDVQPVLFYTLRKNAFQQSTLGGVADHRR